MVAGGANGDCDDSHPPSRAILGLSKSTSAPASASPLFLQRPDVAQSDSASWLGGAGDEEWDGKGEVMPLEGDSQRGLFGIGATLVRDSRGLFFVAETHSTRPHEATSLVQDLRVGDIIVEVDGIQFCNTNNLVNPSL